MQAVDKAVEHAVQLLGWMEGLHFTCKPLSLLLPQPCPILCPLQIFVIKEGGSRFNWENTPYSKVGGAAQDCRHRLAGNSLLASCWPPCSRVLKAHPLNADLPSPHNCAAGLLDRRHRGCRHRAHLHRLAGGGRGTETPTSCTLPCSSPAPLCATACSNHLPPALCDSP